MATLVCFHAHPDDEAIATAGTMAQAAADGHRVVLVVATKGEHGEVAEGVLREGESLWERRVEETNASAAVLGVHRVEFLGYVDSGMIGTPENEAAGSFWQADLDEAAGRLAAILREENAEVLTVYDDHGGYGHPDHIQVHRVGVRAAELAGTPRVYESTIDRDLVKVLSDQMADQMPDDMNDPDFDIDEFGSPAAMITTRLDVTGFVDAKRRAMAAHASQISETSFFLTLPPEVFDRVFGSEVYIRRGPPPATVERSLFEE